MYHVPWTKGWSIIMSYHCEWQPAPPGVAPSLHASLGICQHIFWCNDSNPSPIMMYRILYFILFIFIFDTLKPITLSWWLERFYLKQEKKMRLTEMSGNRMLWNDGEGPQTDACGVSTVLVADININDWHYLISRHTLLSNIILLS